MVAALTLFKRHNKPTLDALYKYYGGVCQFTFRKMKKSEAAIEHILPASMGGRNDWTNVILVHKDALRAHEIALTRPMSGKTHIIPQLLGRMAKPPGKPLPAPKRKKRIPQPDRTWSNPCSEIELTKPKKCELHKKRNTAGGKALKHEAKMVAEFRHDD